MFVKMIRFYSFGSFVRDVKTSYTFGFQIPNDKILKKPNNKTCLNCKHQLKAQLEKNAATDKNFFLKEI